MFEMLMWLYGKGDLTAEMLARAVIKKWITEEQKQAILATKN